MCVYTYKNVISKKYSVRCKESELYLKLQLRRFIGQTCTQESSQLTFNTKLMLDKSEQNSMFYMPIRLQKNSKHQASNPRFPDGK